LTPVESVWLSPTVELTLMADLLDPLDRADSSAELDLDAVPPRAATITGAATGTHGALDDTPPSVRGTPPVSKPGADDGSDQVKTAATELFAWAEQQLTSAVPARSPSRVDARPFPPSPDRVVGTLATLDGFRRRIGADPWDPRTLFALAVYLQQIGLPEYARRVLRRLHYQNPTDPVVNESLGVLYRLRSIDRTRPLHDRATDLERANKHLRWALLERPGDTRLAQMLSSVATQLAVMRPVRTGQSTTDSE
jgi:hypothetical protein